MEITALNELDAVNEIIGTLGESPINSLENMSNIDAINALRILRTISRQEQARGWSFLKTCCFGTETIYLFLKLLGVSQDRRLLANTRDKVFDVLVN